MWRRRTCSKLQIWAGVQEGTQQLDASRKQGRQNRPGQKGTVRCGQESRRCRAQCLDTCIPPAIFFKPGQREEAGTIDTMEILAKWQNEKFNTSGCRLLLMPLTRWLRHAQENRGLTGSQAQVQWDEKEAAYGRGMLRSIGRRRMTSCGWPCRRGAHVRRVERGPREVPSHHSLRGVNSICVSAW